MFLIIAFVMVDQIAVFHVYVYKLLGRKELLGAFVGSLVEYVVRTSVICIMAVVTIGYPLNVCLRP